MASIYVYSPSGAVRDRAALRRAVQRLHAAGHTVEVDADALRTEQRFAGDDATRLAAIARAARSGADVALCTRGGYGLHRLLPDLPYACLAQAIAQGTRFMGLSDFTALQLALLAHDPQAITWAGCTLLADWGQTQGVDDIMRACFDELLDGSSEGAGWRVSKRDEPDTDLVQLPAPVEDAQLWGGNLCVLTSLLGTPYLPHIHGGVLFLEDISEHPYRIERMLAQLLHAGVLDAQQAIVLGQFTGYTTTAHDRGYNLKAVVRWLRAHTTTPVLTGLPHGHVPTKVLLPVGARIHLHTHGRDRLLLWGHQPHPAPSHCHCDKHCHCAPTHT